MDVLSAMSTVAGYKAVLIAAHHLPKFFPLLMTAAGTIAPARVFVLGAGVAGLQAIATARRLGAVVEAFDVRPAVRDEVQSLGATFVGHELLDAEAVAAGGYAKEMTPEQQAKQRELVAERLKQSDVVVSTAMVPGRKAPILIPEATVRGMRAGSVIVDLAAEMGGNCELTEPGREVVKHGITILGPLNLAATVPVHASQMYSRNIAALLTHLVKDKALHLDFEDEITRDTCLVRAGLATSTATAGGAS
jgi:NAD(P) transhydrogenase subunit alpha